MSPSKNLTSDGGAGIYLGTSLLAFFVTFITLGIAHPFALVRIQRWKAKHTYIKRFQLTFTGTGVGLFGHWIKWLLLCIITLEIDGFWIIPKLNKWVVEHTDFDSTPSNT